MAHILIIDDDLQFRQMLATMLQADHHRVTQAGDGEEGLRQVAQATPDLVITDVLMPKVDGIEFVVELRRSGKNIPVIAISGGRRSITAEFNLDSASLMGVNDTLPKPFSRDDLRSSIRRVLG